MKRDRLVDLYQLDCLYKECAFLRNELDFCHSQLEEIEGRLSDVQPSVMAQFARKAPFIKVLELYWTIERFVASAKSRLRIGNAKAAVGQREADPIVKDEFPPLGTNCPVYPASVHPRVFIDVTSTAKTPADTGIQRYVRTFAREAAERGLGLPVIIDGMEVRSAYSKSSAPTSLQFETGDSLLLLDSHWDIDQQSAKEVFLNLRQNGGKLISFFHDVIPITHPYVCDPDTARNYRAYMKFVLPLSDAVLCSSRTGAASIAKCATDLGLYRREVPIGWIPAPFVLRKRRGNATSKMQAVCADGHFFLSVGTLEPRKGYAVALSAFEDLWARGYTFKYVIVGRAGWNMKHFEQRIRSHPAYNSLLFWFDSADDDDLAHAYENAKALIAASIEEGFGMPLLEAKQHGCPTICSDISIFREVASETSTFFDTADALALTNAIIQFRTPRVCNQSEESPADSVRLMTDMIRRSAYQLDFGRA